MSDIELKCMSKANFKKIVKSKIRQAAFQHLESLKQQHSKMDGIRYEKFAKAEYLSSPLFNSESRKLLLALRTRTVNGIRNDFRGRYPDIKCPLMCDKNDTLQHILECVILKSHHTNNMIWYGDIQYQDCLTWRSETKASDRNIQAVARCENKSARQPTSGSYWSPALLVKLCKSLFVLSLCDICR